MRLSVKAEHFELFEPFTIANYAWQTADVCTVELERDGVVGRGEGAPVFYHGETAQKLADQIEAIRPEVSRGSTLQTCLSQAARYARSIVRFGISRRERRDNPCTNWLA